MNKMTFTVLVAACFGATRRSWVTRLALSGTFLLAFTIPRVPAQQIDDHNPVGVSGAFGGNIETGGSYGALDHSAHRGPIDDIVVPGSIGKYPLKMTRYYNSRSWYANAGLSGGWAHEYSWLLTAGGSKVASPQGAVYDFQCGHPLGVSEGWDDGPPPSGGTWRLADGGRVHFLPNFACDYIEDPYRQRTNITWANGLISRVTEPGGRYLQFTFGTGPGYTDPDTGAKMLEWVKAYDGRGNQIDSVHYTYADVDVLGNTPCQNGNICKKMLTGVTYSDGSSASYTYRGDNVPEQIPLGSWKAIPLLETCNDIRYKGPMRQIAYVYQNGGPHGEITKERYSLAGAVVSSITPNVPPPTDNSPIFPEQFTETRGDGPSRTFTYTPLQIERHFDPNERCPNIVGDTPPQQFLQSYTDFQGQGQGHTTYLGYDANWYVNSVTDANQHTTSYTRGGIGEIKKITYPDGTHIDYGYYDESQDEPPGISGHYLTSIKNYNSANQ
ncbi:MAG: hypothetical protein J2P56_04390, partial [Verrucomicrobia bacterium]|nr:hypothetical protein [Verrucomicrobiota bacterium]